MLSVYLLSLILALIPLQYAGELPANGISDLLSQISASSELRDIGARSSTEVDGCVYDYVIYQDGTVTIIGVKGGAGDYTVHDVLDGHPVTALGTFSLYGNEALTRVKVPEGVVRIEDYAFGKCTALTAVEFPGSLAEIGKNPFISCPALTSVILPDAHPDLYVEGGILISRKDARAITCLPGLNQTACAVPEGIEIIDDYAFTECYSLEEVTFPDSLLVIREGAFCACTGLKAVKLPKKVSALGSSAFCGCSSLTAVLLPASLTGLGSNPFADCPLLIGIAVSPENEYIACEDGALISRADRRLIYYPIAGGRQSYRVPEGIVEIRHILKELCEKDGKTIIISSHLLAELSELCTDYVIINEGQIVESLSKEELMLHSRSYISIRTDRIAETIASLEQTLSVRDYKVMEDNELRLYEYLDDVAKVSRAITEAGFTILRFAQTSDSLEEYYLSRVSHRKTEPEKYSPIKNLFARRA